MTPEQALELSTSATLRTGVEVQIRPILPSDKEYLVSAFKRLSPESVYMRFFSPIDHLSASQLKYFTEIDYTDHFAFIASHNDLGVGVARYVRLRDNPTCGEAAVAVTDDFHHHGIGTLLLEMLAGAAIANGLKSFQLLVRSENTAMVELTENLGAKRTPSDDPGVIRFALDLPELVSDLRSTNMWDLFRAVGRGDATLGPRIFKLDHPADQGNRVPR